MILEIIYIPKELIYQYQLRIQEKEELILFLKEIIKNFEENKLYKQKGAKDFRSFLFIY